MVRLIFNPSSLLSEALRLRIMDYGIKLDDYVANIERSLRARKQFDLVSEMLQELQTAVAEQTRGLK